MTLKQIRTKVVETIKAWVGAKKGDAVHKEILAIYNGYKPLPRGYKMTVNDAWCAATVSAAWIKAGVSAITPVECGVGKMIALAKTLGIWVEDDAHVPSPGDAIVYDWDDKANYATTDNKGVPDHVGIVQEVKGDVIYVIEGNMKLTGGVRGVGVRKINVNGRYIRGFICPNYKALATPYLTNRQVALEVINGKWGNGATRKTRLTAAGYDYKTVQKEVNRLLKSKVTYTVKAGDTLSQIAGWYCRTYPYTTTYQQIAEDNGIKNPNVIRAGQKLTIYAK